MTMASFTQVGSVLVPLMMASAGAYYVQRHKFPMPRSFNTEWYTATEAYLSEMPRQGSATPVRMNPFHDKIKTVALPSFM
ncbi:hypothetical protein D9Q98_003345 [Chlorella vulgaris]|uniref:Uncharacterized protein n=1 Tax=Chlorella vulgaris TaxID=3077 RepID=A0A9D4YZC4_CHLVU|nr:hypothetical protein D9Q98_003345 [Chlorella vulgaris]